MPLDLSRDSVIRWDTPKPAHARLLKEAGINAVVATGADSDTLRAFSSAGITVLRPPAIELLGVAELEGAKPGANVVLTNGQWPGIRRPPATPGRGDETASASREPWVDANGFWIGYLRALYPDRPAVLGYTPDTLGDRAVPFDTLELALVEAWVAGGNYLLSIENNYRESLLRNDGKATAAWRQLGITGRWLRENIELFRQPSVPAITALVETGISTAEIANLLYRRNASPALAPAAAPPAPDPHNRIALVAANLRPPNPTAAQRILAHAEAGAAVIVAASPSQPWWRTEALKLVREEPDRTFYSVGKGRLVAYKRAVADPSEFALDVIDVVTHKRRPVRLWNAPAVIALFTMGRGPAERLLHLLNYGSPIDAELQARVQGHFAQATLLRPDSSPINLHTARRGATTEVFVPELKRLGVVVFH